MRLLFFRYRPVNFVFGSFEVVIRVCVLCLAIRVVGVGAIRYLPPPSEVFLLISFFLAPLLLNLNQVRPSIIWLLNSHLRYFLGLNFS